MVYGVGRHWPAHYLGIALDLDATVSPRRTPACDDFRFRVFTRPRPNADIWPKPPRSANGLAVIAAFGIRQRHDAYTPAPGLGSLSWEKAKMATRGRKASKRATAPKRAKPIQKPKSTALQFAGTKSRKPKSGKRESGKPKSETASLKDLLRAAEDRQTATADILKVIASSPSDVQQVFDAIVASANRLIGGFSTAVFHFIDNVAHLAAFTPTNPAADEVLKSSFPRPVAGFEPFNLAKRGQPISVPD